MSGAATVGRVGVGDVIEAVCAQAGTPVFYLYSPEKRRRISELKSAIAMLARRHTCATHTEIAAALGWAEHSTSASAVRRALERIEKDPWFARMVDRAERRLGRGSVS